MPGFEKSPPALIERFTAVVTDLPDVDRRPMFGYPCIFVGGNLVSGLFQDQWFVRLPADAAADLAAIGGERFAPMPGRPMTGYITMPGAVIHDGPAVLSWVERAIENGRSLPAKARKPTKRSVPKA